VTIQNYIKGAIIVGCKQGWPRGGGGQIFGATKRYSWNIFLLGYGWLVLKLWIILREIISRVETSVYQCHISDYSSDVLAPHIGWRSGQLPGCPAP